MSEREKHRRAEQSRLAMPDRFSRFAYSIQEFCDAHSISRAMFYKLQHGGIAPRVMKVGTRTLISDEAAADWRRDRELASASAEAA
jgi:hypothetical protein